MKAVSTTPVPVVNGILEPARSGLNLLAAAPTDKGTLPAGREFEWQLERPMLTTVDRVIAKLSQKLPASAAQAADVRDDAMQFAAQLLETYKGQLSRRNDQDQSRRSNVS
jgi:hypothetical protein